MGAQKRTFAEALMLYVRDSNKIRLIRVARVMLLILAGYAPFAALNDVLVPFSLGLPLIDDLEIPLGLIAAVKVFRDIRKYQSSDYQPRRK